MSEKSAETVKRESNGDSTCPLVDCCSGESLIIASVESSLGCGQRLRELGLVEGAEVLLLKHSDPVLLLVKDSRIAIDPKTAGCVRVYCSCREENRRTRARRRRRKGHNGGNCRRSGGRRF